MRRPRLASVPALVAAGAAAALLLALGPGCSGKDVHNPGELVGVFHVTGKLTTNGCVAAGGAPDPWEFDVQLNRDGATLYWVQGDLPIKGRLDAHQHALLQSSGTTVVRAADAKNKVSGCSITREDGLDTTLGPAPTTTFTGSLGYVFTPTAESDCSAELAVAGGGWAALPCTMSYALTAAKTDKKPLL